MPCVFSQSNHPPAVLDECLCGGCTGHGAITQVLLFLIVLDRLRLALGKTEIEVYRVISSIKPAFPSFMLHPTPNLAPSSVPNHTDHFSILLLVKCLFSICCVPGTVLGVADIWMNKAHFPPQGAHSLVEFLVKMLPDN